MPHRPPQRSFAARLTQLLDDRPHPTGRRYSDAEIAAAVGCSKTLIWGLRTGQSTNPTLETIEALARFFHVDPAYFLSGTERGGQDDELRAAMADAGVRRIAARAAGLSPQSQEMVLGVVERIRLLESGGG